jgi:hypothetical protein
MKRPLFTKQSRAARWRLAGRMRPAGRGLPTAGLNASIKMLLPYISKFLRKKKIKLEKINKTSQKLC